MNQLCKYADEMDEHPSPDRVTVNNTSTTAVQNLAANLVLARNNQGFQLIPAKFQMNEDTPDNGVVRNQSYSNRGVSGGRMNGHNNDEFRG